ncbi:hypothetical protein LIER_01916 [Lithospermum erythrorhizon]|uniref:Uncharacterized protein n=1 Tax=Lithospermum erythrorhizon TaxID=34254 RepID=A0AAV3NNR1_LITER
MNSSSSSTHISSSSSSSGVNNFSWIGNSRTALYPIFTSPKMQKAVEKLVKELNHASFLRIGHERDKNMGRIEAFLAKARGLIKEANNASDNNNEINRQQFSHIYDKAVVDDFPKGDIYRNRYAFKRSDPPARAERIRRERRNNLYPKGPFLQG